MRWNIHKIGVKITFLNGTIDEEVYIGKLQGFEVHGKEKNVCRLNKALYGLKQAPIAWYAIMDAYLLRLSFVKSTADPNLYIEVIKNEHVIILLYVDDLLITSVENHIHQCNKE